MAGFAEPVVHSRGVFTALKNMNGQLGRKQRIISRRAGQQVSRRVRISFVVRWQNLGPRLGPATAEVSCRSLVQREGRAQGRRIFGKRSLQLWQMPIVMG